MNTAELKRRLAAHAAWIDDPKTGERLVMIGSDLRWADLRGSDLRGYRFVGVRHEATTMVCAGCRWLSLPAAERHWAERHSDEPELRAECLSLVASIRDKAETHGEFYD